MVTHHPIDPAIRSEIQQRLAAIEVEHDVRVLYACESGSRGWGFASPTATTTCVFSMSIICPGISRSAE